MRSSESQGYSSFSALKFVDDGQIATALVAAAGVAGAWRLQHPFLGSRHARRSPGLRPATLQNSSQPYRNDATVKSPMPPFLGLKP
jgi:hypothetical protein